MVSGEFTKSAEPFAIMNISKGVAMSINAAVTSFVATQEDYRQYFIVVGIINVLSQMIILFTFKFSVTKNKSLLEGLIKEETIQ